MLSCFKVHTFGPGLQVNNQQAMKLKQGQLKVMMPFASSSGGAAGKGAKAASRRVSKDSSAGEGASTQGRAPRRRAPRTSVHADDGGSAYGGGDDDCDLIDDEDEDNGLVAYGEEREQEGHDEGHVGVGSGASGPASQVQPRIKVGGLL